MLFTFEFHLPNGKGRLPSRFFFTSLDKLGVDIDKYLLPKNWKMTPEEMLWYCNSIEFDLLSYVKEGGIKNQDYCYAKDMIGMLKSWCEKGYTINIL